MNWISILGFVASIMTILAYLPQVIKTWKTRHTKDLSLATYFTFLVAGLLWITYAFLKKDWAIIVTNSILMTFQLSLVYLILQNNKKK